MPVKNCIFIICGERVMSVGEQEDVGFSKLKRLKTGLLKEEEYIQENYIMLRRVK
jgi:hypothetical protein